MRILQTIASMHQSGGGPQAMLAGLSDSLVDLGHDVMLAYLDGGEDRPEVQYDRERVVWVALNSSRPVDRLVDLAREKQVDVLHTHGLWLPMNRATYEAAKQLRRPLVWTTHGMLRPWAFKHKQFKKRCAWWLFQRKQLKYASVVHATCGEEAGELRALLPDSRIEVVPIGIDPPLVDEPVMAKEKLILFMGRLHPVKGLMTLIEAMHVLRPEGWRCVLAGPDEKGYRAVLEQKIETYGLEDWFRFTGPVSGAAKADLLRRCALFVLPSYTENFGVVVPEALSNCTPVLTTDGTPWSVLSDSNCGWQVEIGVAPLVDKLREVLDYSLDELYALGQNGRALVCEQYTRKSVADRFTEIYESMV